MPRQKGPGHKTTTCMAVIIMLLLWMDTNAKFAWLHNCCNRRLNINICSYLGVYKARMHSWSAVPVLATLIPGKGPGWGRSCSAHSSAVHSLTALGEAWAVDHTRLVVHNITFQLKVIFSNGDHDPQRKYPRGRAHFLATDTYMGRSSGRRNCP